MKDHAPHAPSAIVHQGTEGDRGGRVTALYPIHPYQQQAHGTQVKKQSPQIQTRERDLANTSF